MKSYKKVKENVYKAPENFQGKVKEFFLAVAVDEDGTEGVVAQLDLGRFPPVEKPLMGATQKDKESIIEAAQNGADQAGIVIRLLRFTNCEVIKEFRPTKNEKMN